MSKHSKRWIVGASLIAALLQANAGYAQPKSGKAAAQAPVAAAAPNAAVASAKAAMPDTSKLTLLIQMTIAAVAFANLTGDYSALSKFGTTAFQTEHPPSRLSEEFKAFRTAALDISPALLFPPNLIRQPELKDDVVRLVGFYDTRPERIAFDLVFQADKNLWRLAAIDVRTVVPEIAAAQRP